VEIDLAPGDLELLARSGLVSQGVGERRGGRGVQERHVDPGRILVGERQAGHQPVQIPRLAHHDRHVEPAGLGQTVAEQPGEVVGSGHGRQEDGVARLHVGGHGSAPGPLEDLP
jgi:hypothetical protein